MAMNNSLAEVRPELVPEWSEKNLPLKPDVAIMFDDPFERAEEERLELEREELRQCEIRKARIALSMLQPLQRERLMKNVCCGLSSRAIAKQEGVYYSSVDKSIAAAKKNFIKFYENL